MLDRTPAPTSRLPVDDEVTRATPIPAAADAPPPPSRPRPWKWIAASAATVALAAFAVLAFARLVPQGHAKYTVPPASTPSTKSAPAAPENKRFDYNFSPEEQPCGASPRVTVFNLNGNIQITGASVRAAKVSARRSVRAADKDAADRVNNAAPVKLSCQGGDLNIATNQEHAPDRSGMSTDLDIVVPSAASIVTREGKGDVTIGKVGGSVFVNRDKASLRLQSIGGDVRVRLYDSTLIHAGRVDGTIELVLGSGMTFKAEKIPGELDYRPHQWTGQNIVGPIHIDGRSASIDLTGFTGQLDAKLIGTGDITLRPSGGTPPPMTVALDSGNIDLTLPSGLGFDLNLATANGRADNEYGSELTADQEGGGAAIKGGEDGPKLRLTTRRGQVTVRKHIVQTKRFVPPPQ